MALIFSTRRHLSVADKDDVAQRLTEPYSVPDVLTPTGVVAAHTLAGVDKALRNHRALGVRPAAEDAKFQAGLVGTSLIDPGVVLKTPRFTVAIDRRSRYGPSGLARTVFTGSRCADGAVWACAPRDCDGR